jgi:predicted Zn-dependent protease
MTIGRVFVLLLAVLACAWFVLGIRQAHGIDAATSAISAQTRLSGNAVRRVNSSLDAAATLNPDQEVNVLRARLALAQGDERRARAILRQVTRREPSNLEAWVWYAQASANDPVQFYAAQYVIDRLVRRVGGPR